MRLTQANPEWFNADDHGPLYRLREARKLFPNVEDLGIDPGLYLAWEERGGLFINFAVLSFVVSGCSGDPDEKEEFVSCIVEGSGTLHDRDMRHSYWAPGDEGYFHCLSPKEIIAIGTALSRWFD